MDEEYEKTSLKRQLKNITQFLAQMLFKKDHLQMTEKIFAFKKIKHILTNASEN